MDFESALHSLSVRLIFHFVVSQLILKLSVSPTGNGLDTQKLDAQFPSLTAGSKMVSKHTPTADSHGVSLAFAVTQCAGQTQSFALPLANSAGMSIACSVLRSASPLQAQREA
ncbi:hypothetical protein BV25DRAFT_1910834 [Artomyces pyxidatus]|uniref:Uncharacterized protein n=1 Tax=Artomyces pyxidatus TaxID=48021 RepID=A0ACB8TL19_9AGAM|nr:hypothetical protein BV25DRAFT_1910834 [Artomyces pyxidatus]